MAAGSHSMPHLFYHGTKANLVRGELIAPGYSSNYGRRKTAAWVYLTATLDAATWGAELAIGDEPGRIYIVEPTGPIGRRSEPHGQAVPGQSHEVIPDT